jgi:ribonuclease BN (tRNA processing enzyme)
MPPARGQVASKADGETGMKLTVLGSGTNVPDGGRNSSGYFIESHGVRMMVDCGAGTLHALARYGLPWERMTHLFISHFHVDHCGELASLFFAFRHGLKDKRAEPLTLIAPRGIDRVMDGLKAAFGENLFAPKFPFDVRAVSPGDRVGLSGDCWLTVEKTPHTAESLAARVEAGGRAICYTGDTDHSDEVSRFFAGASLVVSECSFRERRKGALHLSIKDAAGMAAAARAERLLVTHFYFDVDEDGLRRELREHFSGEVLIGRDGLTVEV